MGYVEIPSDRPVCLECGEEITYGRPDRKFCSDSCKNRYHNSRTYSTRAVRLRVLNALDRNYNILDSLCKQGVRSISLGDLAQMGYNMEYVTSHHKVAGGHNEYRCFDIKYCLSQTKVFSLEKVGQK